MRQQVLPGDDALLRPLAQHLHQEQAHQKQLEAAATGRSGQHTQQITDNTHRHRHRTASSQGETGQALDNKQLETAYRGVPSADIKDLLSDWACTLRA
jgi:hypothetical protein